MRTENGRVRAARAAMGDGQKAERKQTTSLVRIGRFDFS
jgi:hypothetical protein